AIAPATRRDCIADDFTRNVITDTAHADAARCRDCGQASCTVVGIVARRTLKRLAGLIKLTGGRICLGTDRADRAADSLELIEGVTLLKISSDIDSHNRPLICYSKA